MASWRDGAEYAPLERPYGFATPVVDPIEQVAPTRTSTPGPTPPPASFAAVPDAVPLTQIRVQETDSRDPREPFAVVSALISAESSWGGDPTDRTDFDPNRPMGNYQETPQDAFPPPVAAPYPAPAPNQLPPGYPPPGYPPYAVQPTRPGRPNPGAQPLGPAKIQLLWASAILLALGWYAPGQGIWFLIFAGVTSALSHRRFSLATLTGITLNILAGDFLAPYQAEEALMITCAVLGISAVLLAIYLGRRDALTPPPGPDRWGNQH